MSNNHLYEELDKSTTLNSEKVKLPAMYIFVNNMLMDMQDLSIREAGAYSLLLFHMWRNGGAIPDNNKTIARYLGNISQKEVKKIREKLAFKLEFCEGSITIPGLQKQYNDAVAKHQHKSKAGYIGGKASANNKNNQRYNETNNYTEPRQRGESKLGDVLEASFKQIQ